MSFNRAKRGANDVRRTRQLVVLDTELASANLFDSPSSHKKSTKRGCFFSMLLDSGSTASIISTELGSNGKLCTSSTSVEWSTVDGKFSTKKKCELVFALPIFSSSKKIFYEFHLASKKIKLGYDAIAGTDFLATLGITLNFQNRTMTWDGVTIDMEIKNLDKNNPEELFFVKEPIKVLQSTKRALRILDANYVATSTDELCEKQIHLKPIEMEQLKDLLKNYKKLFDGN